ncbi:alcohol dehydrogenase catalytic domain-containing protein [Frankia sp. Ag45/Mut15]|uniref:Alcohol dehydrogenase catalytic domain-containing protein n=1 Tax=Frankia umida TaxID=573489 RepID=A0ABT0K4L8_9ACTN|nr:alcohol dehydrogenase catalytic domain-containing protein [Frankia umida]MCK9878720.1 alcohol dehydrogenase catalytic domain-containing protein [Frankia umida]
MRAARLHGARDIRIEEVPEPSLLPDGLLLRPRFTGLCGSDLHVWHAGPFGDLGPMVLGHEFSAEVVAVGDQVTDDRLRPGTLVAVEPMWTCGQCGPCRRGAYNLCRDIVWHGLSEHDGGLGELTAVRACMAHPLPDGVDALAGALVEPLAVAHHAVGRGGLGTGGTAAVLGAGPIGIAVALNLVARGVALIVVSEPSLVRRTALTTALAAVGVHEPDAALAPAAAPGTAAALGTGAGTGAGAGTTLRVVDPAAEDLPSAVAGLTEGDGVEVVFDAAGVEPAFQAGLRIVRPGGRVVTVAIYARPVAFRPLDVFFGEIDLVASCAYQDDFPSVIDLLRAGAFPTDGWVHPVAFDTVGAAFETLDQAQAVKLLVDLT